jgi:hypothetical protein
MRFVERGARVVPFFLLHDREHAPDLEVGLLAGIFELKEPGDSVRLLEVLDLVNEVGDRVGMSQARDRLRCLFRNVRLYVTG